MLSVYVLYPKGLNPIVMRVRVTLGPRKVKVPIWVAEVGYSEVATIVMQDG